jgi:hypothetical protein
LPTPYGQKFVWCKPAELPAFQQLSIRSINFKNAKVALGLASPPTLLATADEVIE